MEDARERTPRNIMLLIPSMDIGGSERSVCNISRLLSTRHNVHVAVFNGKSAAMGVGGHLVDLKLPARTGWRKPFVAVRRVAALRRAARAHRIDMLLGFTLIGCRYILFAPRKIRRVPCVRGFGETVSREAFYVRMLRKCGVLLFNSEASRQWFIQRHPALSPGVFTLQNCFDLDEIRKQAKEAPDAAFDGFFREKRVVISVGRLCDVKGFDFLIRAFLLLLRSVPDAGLAIVGDGPSMSRLRALAAPGGDSILFVGSKNNPFPYVAASRLYALPSRAEGFPNALVEAMACGVPVVAANCDTGPNEILNDAYDPDLRVTEVVKARYGLLVPPAETPAGGLEGRPERAHEHLARAMAMMLTDDALWRHYRKAAAERARRFSFERSVARYASFIQTQLKGEK